MVSPGSGLSCFDCGYDLCCFDCGSDLCCFDCGFHSGLLYLHGVQGSAE